MNSEKNGHLPVTVLFHSSSLTVRGTEVALYDYAQFNEEILGNKSIVIFPRDAIESEAAKHKFESRFETHFYSDQSELNSIASRVGADVCYFIKKGHDDGLLVDGCTNAVHVVFKNFEPHGEVYAYISDWLCKEASEGQHAYVPHIIRQPRSLDHNLREELGIPEDADVYGTIGGTDSFKIISATNSILDTVHNDPNKYFIFVNTRLPEWFPWIKARIRKALKTGRLIYLDEIVDFDRKEAFINTCDAMIHARRRGETFGIALGEFAVRNKPLIVHYHKKTKDRCHFEILGDTANYFQTKKDLRVLLDANPKSLKRTDRYQQFNPKDVMALFDSVFLGNVSAPVDRNG